MPKLKELLDLYDVAAKAEEARQATAAAERDAAQRAAVSTKRAKLQADAEAALGDLYRELAEPSESYDYIPLRIGPGRDVFLSVRTYWDAQTRTDTLGLVASGPRERNQSVPLPATDEQLAEVVAWARQYRRNARKFAVDQFKDGLHYSETFDQVEGDVAKLLDEWPDMLPTARALADERVAELAAKAERETAQAASKAARQAEQAAAAAAEESALVGALRNDPTALALTRMFLAIQEDRERWQGALDNAREQVGEAYDAASAASDRASRRVQEPQDAAERAEREKRDAESRADDAEAKARKLAREGRA